MSDKTNRGISNLANVIPDVPDAPTVSASNVGTSRAYNNGAATVTITPTTGGLPSSYSITTTPTTTTTVATSSPATITGLASATSYVANVTPVNVSITGPIAGASSSFTATTVPQSPTIGTPTATNETTVSIPFTAGATGGSSITSYTAVSSPAISLSTSGTSTPLTVTGSFAGNQAYTFTIAANNVNGASAASSASSSVTPAVGDFESIATAVGTGSSATITFSSIPSTYKHLQIRFISRRNSGGNAGNNSLYLRFNGSSSLVYTSHRLQGNGTAASSASDGVDASELYLPHATAGSAQASGVMSVGIIDIQDYVSTTKNKTVRSITGNNSNNVNTGYVSLASGLYRATTAITSISLIDASAIAFGTSSTFALYGIRG